MKHLFKYLKKNSLLLFLALIVGLVWKFSMGYFSSAVSAYTDSLIISYAREIIDQGVSEGVVEFLDGKSILKEVYDNNGKVSYAYLETKTLNNLRNNISNYVAESIDIINDGQRFESIELPLGYFFGRNYFFSNSLKIPINLEVVGHQNVEIEKNVDSYGLNTTILQVNLVVTMSIRSVIPFQSNVVDVKTVVPVALEILNNDIPYYLGDILK